MRKAPLVVAFLLLAGAGPAAPQTPKPGPPEKRPAADGPRLNLKLDDPRQYTRETPGEGSAGALPSLGENARALPPPSPMSTTARPFPKDTERGER